jgi:hypothetical protein
MKTTSIPLAKFRYSDRTEVAKLHGLKSIMRVTTPRKAEWYLVLPSVGESDAACVLLKKVTLTKYFRNQEIARGTNQILNEYAARIVA